jgi:hypothetical protein
MSAFDTKADMASVKPSGIFPACAIDESCRNQPDKLFSAYGFSKYVGLRYGGPPTGLDDATARNHPIPDGWRQVIDLEFDGGRISARRHETEGSKPGGAICYSYQCAAMRNARLLRHLVIRAS